MACCAFTRQRTASQQVEVAVRALWLGTLRASHSGLRLLGPMGPRSRMWRSFLTMLILAEEEEAACQARIPEGLPELRVALAGRLLPVSPRAAGLAWRTAARVRPGPITDLAAFMLAKRLERS